MLGSTSVSVLRRLRSRPAAASRRAAEPGAGEADHDIVGRAMSPCLVL